MLPDTATAADSIGSISGQDLAGNALRLARISDPALLDAVLINLGINLEDFEVRIVP